MSSRTTVAAREHADPQTAMRRVLLCRVLPGVMARLRAAGGDLEEVAAEALARGLDQIGGAGTAQAGETGSHLAYAEGHRPLAVPVSQGIFGGVLRVALEHFGGDNRAAAGWLLARGVGMPLAAPGAPPVAKKLVQKPAPQAPRRAPAEWGSFRAVPERPVRRASSAPKVVVDAPTGDELKAQREELGISQRDLANATGLSRGLVAEVERGRRSNALTRLRIAETLRALQRLR